MNIEKTIWEYYAITYDWHLEQEEEAVDKFMHDNDMEFISRRPRSGMMVLTVRREIFVDESAITPNTTPAVIAPNEDQPVTQTTT